MATKKQEAVNPFDDLTGLDVEGAKKYAEAQQALGEHQAYIMHRVFIQSEDGAKLLALWKEQTLMLEVAAPGLDAFQVGVREGWNSFVRDIIRMTDMVEEGKI